MNSVHRSNWYGKKKLSLLVILLIVAGGCSSDTTGYSEPDAGDPPGDTEDVQQQVEDADSGSDLDTGDPDAENPDADSPDVDEPDAGDEVDCDERTLLSDLPEWTLADDVVYDRDSDPTSYVDVFIGDEFPGTNNNFPFYLKIGEYAAMEFTVPQDMDYITGGWRKAPIVPSPEEIGQGWLLIAISPCSGDFDPDYLDESNCIGVSQTNEGWNPTRWSVDPDTDECYIEPGEAYYMNVLFMEDNNELEFPPTPSPCEGVPSEETTSCGTYLQRGITESN